MSITTSLTTDWYDVIAATSLDVRRWRRAHPGLFGHCRTADDVLSAARVNPDGILGFLIAEHQSEHQHAGRIVWHAMLPKMRVMERRDPLASLEDYTSHLWLRICTYPLAARPHRIAANLALDTLKAVKREQARLQPLRGEERSLDEVTAHRVLTQARDLGLIDASTQNLLLTVYGSDGADTDAAAEPGTASAAVRARCSRAVRRLRAHSGELCAQ